MTLPLTLTCRHCGAIIPRANPFGLSATQRRLYAFIATNPDSTLKQIAWAVYANGTNSNGTLSINNAGTQIRRIREKLRGSDIHLTATTGPGATYRLIHVETKS